MFPTQAAGQGTEMPGLPPLPLPAGVRTRMVPSVNGLDMHVLEAGDPRAPALLLLHGFPEIAYSWRAVMAPLAELGFHVIAPDQRGYGRTTGWSDRYEDDLFTSRMPNLVRDVLGLLFRLGHGQAAHVIGHDFGAAVAGWAGLLRPDVFRTVTVMSAPFAAPAAIPLGRPDPAGEDIAAALAALARPRQHYQRYYSTAAANGDMLNAPDGLPAFLRAYFHMKSADWHENRPFELEGWTAEALAQMPTYYIMDLATTMPEAVVGAMPDAPNGWLSDVDLAVYAQEYARTGFQGGLNWYRCRFVPEYVRELQVFAGRRLTTPLAFIAGARDWGVRQTPGALEAMAARGSEAYRGSHLLDGAGHWVQQEQPAAMLEAFKRAML